MSGGDVRKTGTQHKDLNGNVILHGQDRLEPGCSEHKTLDEWQPGDGVLRTSRWNWLAVTLIREGCFLCHSQMIVRSVTEGSLRSLLDR